MPPRFISRQLSHPAGLFVARAMGRLMNRHNAAMNAFSVLELEPGPADRVLEIGFGGGVTLPTLLDNVSFVAGLDRSQAMVEWARARFATAVKCGRADFREGSVEKIPFEETSFDKVCTVNTVYFWSSLRVGFTEIHRVLKPGGRLVVGFLPKEWMDRFGYPVDIFTSRTTCEVAAALDSAGFQDICVKRPASATRWNAVVAIRSAVNSAAKFSQ